MDMSAEGAPSTYRILCVGERWHGSDARSAFESLRRLGHSVLALDEEQYVSTRWRSTWGRVLRRCLQRWMVHELTVDVMRWQKRFQPDLLFVFKGNWVEPELLRQVRANGVVSANFYPDISFQGHTPYTRASMPHYDHIFTTKAFGVRDLREKWGLNQATFVRWGFDPDLHRPVALGEADRQRYGCDVAFIGTWSPKKEKALAAMRVALPEVRLRVWGCQWEKAHAASLTPCIMKTEVIGDEYVKAICGSRICLGLLTEVWGGACSGDLVTARTFQIPACGSLMLHERTSEVLGYFEEGKEIACFGSAEELVGQVRHYLSRPKEIDATAAAGRRRSLESGYSLDERMRVVSGWLSERLAISPGRAR